MATVVNPPIPYNGFLVNGGRAGTLLQVTGFVPHHSQGFAVNFKTGSGDIALHINPRFNQNTIVLNTLQHGNWGGEERVSLSSLHTGKQFELKVLVEHDKFMVAIDGRHHCQYRHRLPKEHIQQIQIEGTVQVQFLSESNSNGPAPIINPPVPFTTMIPGGCNPGKRIVVQGMGTGDFSINVQRGFELFRNVGLHFNPRFSQNTIVLNDNTNGGWGGEERTGLILSPGQPFTVEIKIHIHAFEIVLNGRTVSHFRHRQLHQRPLHGLDALHIDGGIALYRVEFSG